MPALAASLRRAAGTCRCCGFLSTMTTGRMGCRRRGSRPRSSCRCATGRRRAGHAAAGRDRGGPAAGAARAGRDRDRDRRGDPGAHRRPRRRRGDDHGRRRSGGAVSRWRVAADGGVLEPRRCSRTGRPRNAPAPPGRSAGRCRSTPAGGPIALPADGVSAVVHAPTPTDEPLGLPALLLASFPLSPDRRHVAPGPLTDFLIERAADVYAGMLPGLAAGPACSTWCPARSGAASSTPGCPARSSPGCRTWRSCRPADAGGGADPAARRGAAGGGGTPALAEWLAPVLPGLVAGRPGTRRSRCSGCGGCRWRSWPTCSPPSTGNRPGGAGCTRRWRAPRPQELAELGALPVPLADGRRCAARAGCCCRAAGLEHPDRLAVLGLRVVAPEAAHPLLARLGAVRGDAAHRPRRRRHPRRRRRLLRRRGRGRLRR